MTMTGFPKSKTSDYEEKSVSKRNIKEYRESNYKSIEFSGFSGRLLSTMKRYVKSITHAETNHRLRYEMVTEKPIRRSFMEPKVRKLREVTGKLSHGQRKILSSNEKVPNARRIKKPVFIY